MLVDLFGYKGFIYFLPNVAALQNFLCSGFTAQSTHWDHVKHSQFT